MKHYKKGPARTACEKALRDFVNSLENRIDPEVTGITRWDHSELLALVDELMEERGIRPKGGA
jgi:hypothetical protein